MRFAKSVAAGLLLLATTTQANVVAKRAASFNDGGSDRNHTPNLAARDTISGATVGDLLGPISTTRDLTPQRGLESQADNRLHLNYAPITSTGYVSTWTLRMANGASNCQTDSGLSRCRLSVTSAI